MRHFPTKQNRWFGGRTKGPNQPTAGAHTHTQGEEALWPWGDQDIEEVFQYLKKATLPLRRWLDVQRKARVTFLRRRQQQFHSFGGASSYSRNHPPSPLAHSHLAHCGSGDFQRRHIRPATPLGSFDEHCYCSFATVHIRPAGELDSKASKRIKQRRRCRRRRRRASLSLSLSLRLLTLGSAAPFLSKGPISTL